MALLYDARVGVNEGQTQSYLSIVSSLRNTLQSIDLKVVLLPFFAPALLEVLSFAKETPMHRCNHDGNDGPHSAFPLCHLCTHYLLGTSVIDVGLCATAIFATASFQANAQYFLSRTEQYQL